MVRVDDARERGPVCLIADIGFAGPEKLVAGHALARLGHARQAEIGGVGEDHGQECGLVVDRPVRAQIGEGGEEAGLARHLVKKVGDAHARHQCVDALGQRRRVRRGRGTHRRDRQPAVLHGHALDLASGQAACEALEGVRT